MLHCPSRVSVPGRLHGISCGLGVGGAGQCEEGIAQMHCEGLAAWRAPGVEQIALYSALLAEAYGHVGKPAGSTALAEALRCVDQTESASGRPSCIG